MLLFIFCIGDTADAAGRVYVTVQFRDTLIQVVDASNYSLITSINVWGCHPLTASPDGRTVYTAVPKAVLGYNTTTNTLEKNITLEGFTSFDDIVMGDDNRLYGMEKWGRTIYIYDVVTEAKLKSKYTIPDYPIHIALSPDGSRLYVLASQKYDGNAYANQYNLTVYNAANLDFIRAKHFDMALVDIAFSPDGSSLYLLGTNSSTGSKDTKILKLRASDLSTQKTAYGTDSMPWDVVVSPDGNKVYASEYGEGNILKFDDDLTLLGTLDTDDGIKGMVISPNGKKLYVARNRGELLVVDTDRLEITARPMVLGGVDMLPSDIEYVNTPGIQYIQYYNLSFPSVTPTPLPTIIGYAFNGTGSVTPAPTPAGSPEPSTIPDTTYVPTASSEPSLVTPVSPPVTVSPEAGAEGPGATAATGASVPGFSCLLAAGGVALAAGVMGTRLRP